jgi:putative ABC transport system substrate-binding protein
MEVVPSVSRVAALWNPAVPSNVVQLKSLKAVAPALGLKPLPLKFGSREDLDRAFAVMRKERPDALIVFGQALLATGTLCRQIAEFALKNRLPAMFDKRVFVDAGGLMSYGASIPDIMRRAAFYVDRILKGAKPADMPVERPIKFELVINLKTAKKPGLTIPPQFLARADKVIR